MSPETWVLRWFQNGLPERTYRGRGGPMCGQKEAERFESADRAREEVGPLAYGFGGPRDICGWKPVRLVKKVKA